MMSDDLDWTQLLGEAIVNQQKDVLAAIQFLREKAVANGVIKSDDKVTVVEEGDNIRVTVSDDEGLTIESIISLAVLRLPGWERSVGVAEEAAYAEERGISVTHLDPSDG